MSPHGDAQPHPDGTEELIHVVTGRLALVFGDVSYVIEGLRSLVLEGWVLHKLAICMGVIVATGLVLTWLSVRTIENFDR